MTEKVSTNDNSNKTAVQKQFPSLAADMSVCFAICVAAYAYYVDKSSFLSGVFDSKKAGYIPGLILCAVLVITWTVLSVQNGLRGRNGFLAFIIIFWTVPLAVGLLISSVNISSASGITAQFLNIILLFIKIIVQSPMAGINFIDDYQPVTNAFAICVLTSVFAIAYIISYLIFIKKKQENIHNIERSTQK